MLSQSDIHGFRCLPSGLSAYTQNDLKVDPQSGTGGWGKFNLCLYFKWPSGMWVCYLRSEKTGSETEIEEPSSALSL